MFHPELEMVDWGQALIQRAVVRVMRNPLPWVQVRQSIRRLQQQRRWVLRMSFPLLFS